MRALKEEFQRAFLSRAYVAAITTAAAITIGHIFFFVLPEAQDQIMYLDLVQ